MHPDCSHDLAHLGSPVCKELDCPISPGIVAKLALLPSEPSVNLNACLPMAPLP